MKGDDASEKNNNRERVMMQLQGNYGRGGYTAIWEGGGGGIRDKEITVGNQMRK